MAGTKGGDGVGVDVWRGTQSERVTGAIFTVDTLKSEVEVKLLIGCSPEEAAAAVEIHNRGSLSSGSDGSKALKAFHDGPASCYPGPVGLAHVAFVKGV